MAIQVANSKMNFAVSWDDSNTNDAQRAGKLLLTCDNDLDRLFSLIGTLAAAFGPTNRIQLLVGLTDPKIPSNAGGANYGYATNNNTKIYIDPNHLIPGVSEDEASLVLIEELAEVVNSAWTLAKLGGFTEGTSMSEGLSRVMGAELYFDTYYASPKFHSSLTSNKWLTAGSQTSPGSWQRPDWINNTAPSEVDFVATGCAVLFLNFLRYQLNVPWSQIIETGGASFAETYEKVTTKSTAWQDFTELIEEHMPAKPYATGAGPLLKTDNPFPLLPVVYREGVPPRSATVSQSVTDGSNPLQGGVLPFKTGTVHVAACVLAEAKDYTYLQLNVTEKIAVTLTFHGFAFPQIKRWKILDPGSGKYLMASDGETLTLLLKTDREIPGAPGEHVSSNQSVPIQISDPVIVADYRSLQNSLSFSNKTYPGHFQVEFYAEVCEQLLFDEVTRVTGSISFDTLSLVMDDNYITDRARCLGEFWKVVDKYVHVPPLVRMPHPEPPLGWREAIQWAAGARRDLEKHVGSNPREVKKVAGLLGKYFSVEATAFLPDSGNKSE